MNLQALMQQAQQMQKDMESNIKKAKDEIADTEITGEAGGGLAKVIMNGNHVVKRVQISPELLKDEPDVIEDMIAAAVNDAVRQADQVAEEKMNATTSNIGLPPGLGNLFG